MADQISVPIGGFAVASSPISLKTLLGSCVGVAFYDSKAKIGGLAHIVLPCSRGSNEHPGKFADTAIPALLQEIETLQGIKARHRLWAKIFGGANMFQATSISPGLLNIGQLNQEAVERILRELKIPVIGQDLGGKTGRHLTFETSTGIVKVKIPGGGQHEI